MCMSNRTYFKEVGDIASSNKFEQMALHSKKVTNLSSRHAYKGNSYICIKYLKI